MDSAGCTRSSATFNLYIPVRYRTKMISGNWGNRIGDSEYELYVSGAGSPGSSGFKGH